MATYPSNYYNRFDPNKKYKRPLFRAGRGFQSAEANELHDYHHYEMKRITDHVVGDASILSGGSVTRVGLTSNYNAAKAIFYAMGYTHDVPAASINIAPLETVSVGIAILETVVSEDEDASLRDPAINTRNHNAPGAYRLKMEARWAKQTDVTASESYFPMMQFADGELITTIVAPPDLAGAKDLVARFDNRANGSYVVEGFITNFIANDSTTSEHVLAISAGIAHVEGYEQILDHSRRIRLPFATDTRAVNNEPHTFTANGNYPLRWGPIATVGEVNGIIEVTRTVTHGNFTGAADLLPLTPVVKIVSVTQGATTFSLGADYKQTGDSVDWQPSGAEPAPGSTYTVVFQYSAVVPVTITPDRRNIVVNGLAPATVFYVDYEHYIPRYDAILLTRDGEIKSVRGVPDFVQPVPPVTREGLRLATAYLSFGDNPKITLDYFRAFRMQEIQAMRDKIDDVAYNIARLTLQENLRSADPTTTKRGLFVDAFWDDDMRDAGVSQNAIISNGVLSPNIDWTSIALRNGPDITLPSTRAPALTQNAFTKSRQVNAYDYAEAPPGTMTISPTNLRWISRTIFQNVDRSQGWALIWGSAPGTTSTSTSSDALDFTSQPIPVTPITINASKFNYNELVDVYFDSVIIDTLTANGQGILSGTVNTPAWAVSGANLIAVRGRVSGVYAQVVLSAVPLVRTVTTVTTRWWGYDPLAQTFTPEQDMHLASVKLMFTANTPEWAEVVVTDTQVGMPDNNAILGRKRLLPNQINAPAAGNVWTEFVFDNPIFIRGGREHAFIIKTPDPIAHIRTAELGQFDLNNGRWMTKQGYAVGTALESPTGSTWSPIPKEDLTFELTKANFQTSDYTLQVGQTNVTAATDLLLLADIENSSDTRVEFRAVLEARGNETLILSPYTPTKLVEYTGSIKVFAVLRTANANYTPRVKGDIYLAVGKVEVPSYYVSRAVPVLTGATDTKVYLEIFEESSSSIKVQVRNVANTAWVDMTRDTSKAINVGNGWVEMPFTAAGSVTGATSTRFRIILDSADRNQRPKGRSLRGFFS